MIAWKVILGILLFVTSSFIAEILLGFGVSFTVSGTDYAPIILEKILDVFAASLLVWGVLQNPSTKKTKWN